MFVELNYIVTKIWKYFLRRIHLIINYYLHFSCRFPSEMHFHKRSEVEPAKVQKYFYTISYWTAALKFSFIKCLSFHSSFRTDWSSHKILNIYTTKFYSTTFMHDFFVMFPWESNLQQVFIPSICILHFIKHFSKLNLYLAYHYLYSV